MLWDAKSDEGLLAVSNITLTMRSLMTSADSLMDSFSVTAEC